jgi:hypothetical protein
MIRRILGSITSSAVLICGIFYYSFVGSTPKSAFVAMITFFCQTKGYGLDLLNYFIRCYKNLLGKHINFNAFESNYKDPVADSRGLEFVLSELRTKGFCVLDAKIPAAMLESMLQFSFKQESMMRNDRQFEIYQRGNPKSVRYDFPVPSLLRSTIFNDLVTSQFALKIAESYLGCRPWLDVLSMWWHTDFSKEPDSEAAQLYHFDMDRPKWLKIFVYLTDVTIESGPHCFVEGSHKSGAIPRALLRRGYARIEDKEVYEAFGQHKERKFIAPAGTVIIEDTRGLHKGLHVQSGDRLIFQIQFSNSKFGANYPAVKKSGINSQLLKKLDRIGLPCTLFT